MSDDTTSARHEQFDLFLKGSGVSVSAIATIPPDPIAAYVFAHGAGAGMRHEFMVSMSESLVREGIAILRFNFRYMEAGRRTPDRGPVLFETIRLAVDEAGDRLRSLPLFAGGKSMGGRMTSLAQAADPLPGVRGLIFMGFPLHAAGRPGSDRGDHLRSVNVPMLFFQGTRDRLADIGLMRSLVDELGPERATMIEVESADHSFRVPKRWGRSGGEIIDDVARRARAWVSAELAKTSNAP